MKNLKDVISNILGLLIVLSGAIFGLIQEGTLSMLPEWVNVACISIPVISVAILSWMTGKNANLTKKTPEQLNK